MNPYNRAFLFLAWMLVGCAAGAYFFANEPEVGLAALLFNTALCTAVIAGSDRHDRECHKEAS